jgi:hypothetical protein
MLADLFTKIVTSAQDKRLAIRFYNDCVEEYLPEPEEDEYGFGGQRRCPFPFSFSSSLRAIMGDVRTLV